MYVQLSEDKDGGYDYFDREDYCLSNLFVNIVSFS